TWWSPGRSALRQRAAVCAYDLSFFFQTEDGIRDATVTGVQTCALPISSRRAGCVQNRQRTNRRMSRAARLHADGKTRCPWPGDDPFYIAYHDTEWGVPEYDDRALYEKQLGRASCRERVDAAAGHAARPK